MKYLLMFFIAALVAFIASAVAIYNTVATDMQDFIVLLVALAVVEILFFIFQLFKSQKK